jgi:hypothetical protein
MNGQLMAVLHGYSLLSRLFEFVQFQESPKVQMCGVLFGFLLIAVIPSASSPRMRVEVDA